MKNIIIFIIAISFIFSSCCTGEPMDQPTYSYTIRNKTTHNIKIKVFDACMKGRYLSADTTFLLPSNSKVEYSLETTPYVFGCKVDSTYIIFNNNRILIYRRGEPSIRNITYRSRWMLEKVDDDRLEFEYNITEEDYKKAVKIK